MPDPVTFIHKNGRVIPIRTPSGMVQAATAPLSAPGAAISAAAAPLKEHAQKKVAQLKTVSAGVHNAALSAKTHVDEGLAKVGLYHPEIQVNHRLDMLGLGLSVASGVVGAATFSNKSKGFVGGLVGSHLLDAAGTAANIASVSGRGFRKERLRQGAKQEARNFIIGNGIFLAGLVGLKQNRARAGEIVKSLISFGKKAIV